MRKSIAALALLVLAAAACARGPQPARVVLVGVDGGADYLLEEFLADGTLPADGGFARLAAGGARATVTGVNPSVTAPSFASLFTGAYPERHGLMGNSYYRVSEPLSQTRSSFEVPLAAEPLWEPLRRAGRRVVLIGSDIGVATPGLGPTLNFGFGKIEGTSSVVTLTRGDFVPVEGWQSEERRVEQARAARAPLRFVTRSQGERLAHLVAVDTLFDGRERYDRVLLVFDRNPAATAAELAPGQWARVALTNQATAVGAWVKLLELDPTLARVRLYLAAPHRNVGSPVEFVARVEQALGSFWPGEPDRRALARGWIDEATWAEQMERLGNYLRDAALWAMANEQFDLLAVYQPQADQAGHQFLLRDPRQPGYADAATRAAAARLLAQGWQSVDTNLQRLLEAAGPSTHLVAVADHGMSPTHTVVYPHRLLAADGFGVAGPGAQVRAVVSGAQAHLYLNLAGRQAGGRVRPAEAPRLLAKLAATFTGLRDPATGEPVAEVAATRESVNTYRLLHPETTGDLWVCLRPGYTFSPDVRPGPVFEPSPVRGQHGHLASGRQMQTILLAAGPRVRPGRLGSVHSVDVAPTVTALLGVEAPRQAQGRVLKEILTEEARMDWFLPGLRALPNWHPVFVHFPIAFLLGAFLMEALAMWRRRDDWHRVAVTLLYLGALTALVASGTGLLAEETVEFHEASHEVFEVHERLMLLVTSLAVGLALIAALGGRYLEPRRLQGFLLVGLLLVGLILAAGADRGAQLVYQFGTGVNKSALMPPEPARPAPAEEPRSRN